MKVSGIVFKLFIHKKPSALLQVSYRKLEEILSSRYLWFIRRSHPEELSRRL